MLWRQCKLETICNKLTLTNQKTEPLIKQISSLIELLAALSNSEPATLELQTSILCPYSITLRVSTSQALTKKNVF